MNGKISQWKDDNGFGFIQPDDGSEKVFFHISSVKTNARRPQVGDLVVYEAMRDSQQRLKAKGVVIENVTINSSKTYKKSPQATEASENNLIDYLCMLVLFASIVALGIQLYRSKTIGEVWPFAISAALAFFILNNRTKPLEKPLAKPLEKTFQCARCGTIADYDHRTLQAWNQGFTKLYCRSCHSQWLRDQPVDIQSSMQTKGSGCLGMLAILVIAPIGSAVSIYQWLF